MNREVIDLKKNRPGDRLYIACLDMDFSWYPVEVNKVINMWQEGKSIWEIAEEQNRCPDEVAILIIDLARRGKISPRSRGVHRCRKKNQSNDSGK